MDDSAFSLGLGSIDDLTSRAELVTDLKNVPVPSSPDVKVVFLIGKASLGDNRGGFYRWDPAATGSDDAQFMNVIGSNMTGTGRWVRIFQRAIAYTQGYLVNAGGIKTFWAPGTTDSTGKVTIYITDDNTATGNALFTEVWQINPQRNPASTSTSAPIIGDAVLSSDLKTLTVTFSKSASTTLAGTLLGIAGSVIPGLTAAPSGLAVQIKVEGV